MADPGWGIWGKCSPSPCGGASHTSESDYNTKLYVRPRSVHKTRENMHIFKLLAFITNSPETKANHIIIIIIGCTMQISNRVQCTGHNIHRSIQIK